MSKKRIYILYAVSEVQWHILEKDICVCWRTSLPAELVEET